MFGYININRKELAAEAAKAYQAYYCGLCQKLKKSCGTKGQMLLNYDMTFLVVLLTGLYELGYEETAFTCPIHPTRKQTAWINEATEYAADMNVILACHNLEDDWRDGRAYTKKAFARAFVKDYERIRQRYPGQVAAVERYMKELTEAEAAEEENIDRIAGLTGEMTGEVFSWKQDEWAEELHCMGFYMGKFIYLMDAYEDLEKDKKHQAYNPFAKMVCEQESDFETFAKLLLTSMMSECAKSFERMPILLHADILRNVLYSGVWSRYEYIQLKKRKQERKKKGKPNGKSL